MTTSVQQEAVSPGQQRAVLALLASAAPSDAARAAGCSERTLRRWRRTAGFQQALRAAARDAAAESMSRLIGAQGEAVTTLVRALRSPSDVVAVRAGIALLELGLRVTDDDTAARLTDLERRANRWQPTEHHGLTALTA